MRLSDSHQRQLKESAIAEEVEAARGYRTIRSRSEVPEEFADWQRRLGLLVPTHSPDGVTNGHQLKPNKPIRRKNGSAPKYETPTGSRITLDVNPMMLEEVRSADGDLWVTEGPKKVDSLTSQGLPTVGIIGVWNFAEPGSKGTTPLSCWYHVRLSGRRVIIVYDADAKTNPDVQEALRRLVAMLEALGAEVLVVYLPAVNGDGKAGVDDYLAAGGTVAELRMMAGPYQPVDVGTERLSRDERLRAAVEELRAAWWGADWNRFVGAGENPHWARGYSARDVEDAMLRIAARSGKLTPEGLQFTAGVRTISDESARSRPSTMKAIRHLKAEGRILIHEPEGDRKARSYTLLTGRADLYHKGRGSKAGGGYVTPELQRCDPSGKGLRAPDVPRLRWSSPPQRPRKVLLRSVPRKTWGVVGEYRERIERLGPHRGALVDALEASGGELPLAELCEVLRRSRPRDVKRRTLPALEAAEVIEVEGDVVRLTPDWRENLEAERERSGEIAIAERQAERHRYEREQFRKYGPAPPAEDPPQLMGPERVEEVVREREKEDLEARIEDQRRKVGTTVETFVYDKLKALGRIRLALLMEVYADAGGDPWEVPPALRRMGCRIERLPEFGNRQFVFPPLEGVA
jgi:hypothetical protein